MPGLRDGAERRLVVLGIAQHVRADEGLAGGDEAIVDRSMNVHALDRAAALPRVVDRAVDDVLDCLVEIAVGRGVGGVVAAELEADVQEAITRGRLDAMTAMHRAGEEDVIDPWIGDELLGALVVEEDGLNGSLRPARLGERTREVLTAERRAG